MAEINRGTLPADLSSEILAKAVEESAIMSLARRIELPGNGAAVPVITGDATADWVAETGVKPVSNSTFELKTVQPYKLAVIETVSKELTRDLPALYAALYDRLPAALAAKFDGTVMGGTAPGSNFDVLTSATAVAFGQDVYAAFVSADGDIAENGGIMNGIIMSPQGRTAMLNAIDGNGYPLFTSGVASGAVTTVLGAPVHYVKAAYKAGTPNQLGFAGDWTQAIFGMVEGIEMSISDQATLTVGNDTINLWQQNMVAIRAEVEVGFRADTDCFVKLTA